MTDQHAAFFKCFSTASRNRIVYQLSQHGELSVEELARRVGLKVPTVSRHLQLMALQGIVRSRYAHPARYYSFDRVLVTEKLEQFLESLGATSEGARPNRGRRTAANPGDSPLTSSA